MAWRAGEFSFVYCREREPRKRAAEKATKLFSSRAESFVGAPAGGIPPPQQDVGPKPVLLKLELAEQ